MSNKERWLTVAILAVIALLFSARSILIALGVLIPYEVEVRKEQDPITITTPLYGAEKVLQQLGFETGRWRPETDSIGAGETLFLPGQELWLSLRQVDALTESVRNGAHLVVLAPYSVVGLGENQNLPIARLLSAFGVSAVSFSALYDETDLLEPIPESNSPRFTQGGPRCPAAEDTSVDREDGHLELHPPLVPSSAPIEVLLGPMALQTSSPPECWVGVPAADGSVEYVLVQTTVGLGRVTVIASPRAFDNSHLRNIGRAHLLAGLARQQGFDGRVWFPARFSRPSLGSIVMPLGWPFVIAIGGAVLAWIWASGARFGPMVRSEPAARRRLAEHIEATGRWAWRYQLHEALIAHTRRLALDRLFLRHPHWRSLDQAQLQQQLASWTQLPLKTIEQGFYGSVRTDASRFIAAITLWERIRKQR